MSGRWWRAYSRARHEAKLLKLSDKNFRWWFSLVCVASENGGVLPPHADLAVEFRVTPQAMTRVLDALIAAELFDHDDTGIRPHNWNVLQYVSDSSSNRVKQFRERRRNVSETPSENRDRDIGKAPSGLSPDGYQTSEPVAARESAEGARTHDVSSLLANLGTLKRVAQ